MAINLDSVGELMGRYVGDINPASKKGKKRRDILDAAAAMFTERGYRGTSMDDLATAVGVAKGTLYLYFPKKVDLVIACAAREKLAWLPRMREILEEGDKPAHVRLRQWIVATLMLPSASPLMTRLMDEGVEEIIADYPPELMAAGEAMATELLSPLLTEVAGAEHRWSPVELADRLHAVRSLAHLGPVIRHEWARPGMSVERFTAILADMVVDGLRTRTPTNPSEETP